MKIEIKQKEDLKTTEWSGGKTTELYIFPQHAEYQKCNFDFRISTASIDVDFSEFTSLPGFQRTLMILDGKIRIVHENHHEEILQKFDQDSFLGNWKTVSYGKAVDFNVMSKSGIKTDVNSSNYKNDVLVFWQIDSNFSFYALYLSKGKIAIELDFKDLILNEGDFLILSELERNVRVKVTCLSDVEFVQTTVGVE